MISIPKFIQGFQWDETRFPINASITDQLKNIEEKLESIDKNLKVKQQNFHDSKLKLSSAQDKKENAIQFINGDISTTIFQLIQAKKFNRPQIFVQPKYLQSFIAFVPKHRWELFSSNYDSDIEHVVPDSLSIITEQFEVVMAHFIGLRQATEDFQSTFKKNYDAIVHPFVADLASA